MMTTPPEGETLEQLAALAISLAAALGLKQDADTAAVVEMHRILILHLSRGQWEEGPSEWGHRRAAEARAKLGEAMRAFLKGESDGEEDDAS